MKMKRNTVSTFRYQKDHANNWQKWTGYGTCSSQFRENPENYFDLPTWKLQCCAMKGEESQRSWKGENGNWVDKSQGGRRRWRQLQQQRQQQQQLLLLLLLLLLHMTIKKDKKMRTSLFRWSKKHCVLMASVLFFSRSLQMFCRMIFGRHENSRSCPEGWPTVFGFWAVFVQGKKSERSWEGSAFWSIHCAACEKMRCNENRAPTNMKFSQNAVVPKHLSLLILRHLITSACLQTRCLPSELQDPSSMEFPGSF